MTGRREEIQKAAYDLMGIKGLEEVHARTVAAQIGINHATVHYHFPARSDLLMGVAEFALRQFNADRERFQAHAADARTSVEAELALAEAYCRPTSRFVKVLAGLYVASVGDKALRERLAELWSAWHGFLADRLAQAPIDRSSPFADAQLTAATFFGLGLASHMLDGKVDAATRLDEVFRSLFEA